MAFAFPGRTRGALVALSVAAVGLTACAGDQGRDGSVIPNPVRTWGDASAENGPRNPIPLGSVGRVEGWDVTVLGFTEVSVDDLGQSAPPDHRFYKLEVEAKRVDREPIAPAFLAPGLLGASNVERGLASDPVCFAGRPVNAPVEAGQSVRHASCISIAEHDAASFDDDASALVLSLGLLDETWFALR